MPSPPGVLEAGGSGGMREGQDGRGAALGPHNFKTFFITPFLPPVHCPLHLLHLLHLLGTASTLQTSSRAHSTSLPPPPLTSLPPSFTPSLPSKAACTKPEFRVVVVVVKRMRRKSKRSKEEKECYRLPVMTSYNKTFFRSVFFLA